jgi:hypothetical protein
MIRRQTRSLGYSLVLLSLTYIVAGTSQSIYAEALGPAALHATATRIALALYIQYHVLGNTIYPYSYRRVCSVGGDLQVRKLLAFSGGHRGRTVYRILMAASVLLLLGKNFSTEPTLPDDLCTSCRLVGETNYLSTPIYTYISR